MKQSCKAIIALSFVLAVSAGRLFAQPYSFDEFGNGFAYDDLIMPPAITPLPFQVAADPTGGITNSPVLIYSLGSQVASGDVALMNPDGTIADLLRFFTPSGASSSDLIFYSQPNNTPAGVGIPFSANPVEKSLVSTETVWNPSAGQPGENIGVIPVSEFFRYTIITQTPEPTSAVLLLAAAGVWLTVRRFRRRGRVIAG